MNNNDNNGDWETKYWAQRAQQIAQQKQVGQQPVGQRQQPGNTSWMDINSLDQVLAQRAAQQQSHNHQSGGSRSVSLRDGFSYYRQVHAQGFGTTTPLIKQVGILQECAGRSFVFCKEISGYNIDQLQTVDLTEMANNPDRMMNLIEVEAPFVGRILVPREAIAEEGVYYDHQGRGLLKG